MGILRRLGKFFGMLLLLVFLSSCILSTVVLHFTDYGTIKSLLVDTLAGVVRTQFNLEEENLQQAYALMSAMC